MFKIIVADKISPLGVEFLKQQPELEVVEAYGSTPEDLREKVSDAHGVIVRSESKITREILESATRLKVVGRAGVGVDNIDIEAATEKGVVVMNAPEGNTIATAELTLTHILCGTRPVAQAYASMKAGRWDRKQFSGQEVSGKSLAILGMGRIGTEVARRAQAFNMKVLAVDPYLTETRAKSLDVRMVSLDEAFAEADFITVHMPLTDQTRDLIDADAIARMKDGVRIFNVARGGIVNEGALLEGLKRGKVAAAGLDVFVEEPLAEDHPFRGLDNLVLTPHLGASTREAQENVGIQIAENLLEVLKGGVIRNAINAPTIDAKTLELLRPYLDLGTHLGTFVQQISPDRVERLEITYWGKIVEIDALPLTRAIQKGYLLGIAGGEINDVNAPLKLKRLGIQVNATKSTDDADYSELIEVRAVCGGGATYSAQGTLIGKANTARFVQVNGKDLEVDPADNLLMVENQDTPGMVGKLGTLLGEDGVNIANLSLHRGAGDANALAFFELDSRPTAETMKRIAESEGILSARLIRA